MVDEPDRSTPLLDPEPTVAGLDEVRRAVKTARNLFLVSDPRALAPERLSKRDASRLFDDIQAGRKLVVVTARVKGPDLIIRTVQWLGDESRMGPPRGVSPSAPAEPPSSRDRE